MLPETARGVAGGARPGAVTEAASAPAAPANSASPRTEAQAIPAALRGRWGLDPADCRPGQADAEGLLAVGAQGLEFYESVAALEEVDERSATVLRARFAFSGEGMEWQRDLTLSLEGDGGTLVRREHGEDASPGAFRYTRC